MDINKLIIQSIADSMPDIDDSTPIGAVKKYAEDIIIAAELAAEQHLKHPRPDID